MQNVPSRATGEAMPDHHTSRGVSPSNLPEIYALCVSGDCMVPIVGNGELVEVHRDEMPEPGDLCVIYFRQHIALANSWGALLKRMQLSLPRGMAFPYTPHPESNVAPLLIVESVNPLRQHVYRCEDILAVHKVVGTIDPSRTHRPAEYWPEMAPAGNATRAVEAAS